jgi:Zn-dependent protease
LSCPSCHRLVHADELKQLAEQAERATAAHDTVTALTAWRRALELLPPDSRQFEQVAAHVTTLSQHVDSSPTKPATDNKKKSPWGKIVAGGTFVVVFLLTKGKLLLLGLANTTTLFSMLLSIGVYWTAWGWKLATGLVIAIYVHEMGHVFALHKFGIKATAPMFIPGFGAFVRLKQSPVTVQEDARIGLAGPLWGLGAAVVTCGIFLATAQPFWAALTRVGAWINLFNLVPIWQLDGGRGFRSLSRSQRWLAALVIGAMLLATKEGLLILLLIVAVMRSLSPHAPREPDAKGLMQYALLVAILALMSRIPVPGMEPR